MPSGSKPGERRGGRKIGVPNKATGEIRALAAVHGPDAIAKLVKHMENPNPMVSVSACKEILDRAYGKSSQPVLAERAGGSYDLSKLTDEQLRLGYELARAASTGLGDTD